jgi:hypothetical protein
MELRELSLAAYERALPEEGHELFHRPAALSVLSEYAPASELVLYGGFKGDQPVALLPVFVRDLPLGGRVVSSPVPGMHVPHMGPIAMPTSPKQRKRERVNRRFVEAVLEEVGVDSRTLLYLLCSPAYDDPRPFEWADQSVGVSFTYDVPVDGADPETILRRFSKSRRREIRTAEEADVTVTVGDREDARSIFEQTSARFAEQDEHFGLGWPFVRDLYDALGEDARSYVARGPDGDFLSGILALRSGDAVSFWLGGVRADVENVSVNSLLHWRIVRDVAEDPALSGATRYDMVGAGEYRLSKYKSKFNPRLRRYYVVDSGGTKMDVARAAYATLERVQSRAGTVSSLLR